MVRRSSATGMSQLREELQHRVLGDPGEDGVPGRRGDDGAPDLEQDVHRAHLLDVAVLRRIEPQDLGEPAPEGLLLRLEARRVVRGRLGRPEPPRSGPRVPLADGDLHRVEAFGVIGADRAGDDVEQGLVGGLEADVGLGRDHRRAHVERGAVRAGDPLVVQLEQGFDRADEDVRVHFRQVEAEGRGVEARRVVGRPEQVHGPRAAAVPIRLQPLEDGLAVVQDERGGREVEVRERPYGGIAPAALRRPAHREHVVAVDLPEPERTLVRRLRAALLRLRRLDPEIHAPPPRLREGERAGHRPPREPRNLGRARPQSQAQARAAAQDPEIARRRSAGPAGGRRDRENRGLGEADGQPATRLVLG